MHLAIYHALSIQIIYKGSLRVRPGLSSKLSNFFFLTSDPTPSLPAPPAYLYGLLNVDAGVSDGAEQVVEAAHLLHQHRVHALIVAGGKAPHRCLQVKVSRQLAQDVSCHFKDHVIRGFGVSA